MEFNRNQFLILGVVLLFIGLQLKKVESFTLNERASRLIAERFPGASPRQRRHAAAVSGLGRPDAASHDQSARLVRLRLPLGRRRLRVAQPGDEKARRLTAARPGRRHAIMFHLELLPMRLPRERNRLSPRWPPGHWRPGRSSCSHRSACGRRPRASRRPNRPREAPFLASWLPTPSSAGVQREREGIHAGRRAGLFQADRRSGHLLSLGKRDPLSGPGESQSRADRHGHQRHPRADSLGRQRQRHRVSRRELLAGDQSHPAKRPRVPRPAVIFRRACRSAPPVASLLMAILRRHQSPPD